jgi:hypothetical protein
MHGNRVMRVVTTSTRATGLPLHRSSIRILGTHPPKDISTTLRVTAHHVRQITGVTGRIEADCSLSAFLIVVTVLGVARHQDSAPSLCFAVANFAQTSGNTLVHTRGHSSCMPRKLILRLVVQFCVKLSHRAHLKQRPDTPRLCTSSA